MSSEANSFAPGTIPTIRMGYLPSAISKAAFVPADIKKTRHSMFLLCHVNTYKSTANSKNKLAIERSDCEFERSCDGMSEK